MNLENKTLRLCASAVLLAVFFRLLATGLPGPVAQAIAAQDITGALLYMETGRPVRAAEEELKATSPEEAPEEKQPEEAPAKPVFAPQEAETVSVINACGRDMDAGALLTQPLSWDLTEDGPQVLILHSHASESYTKTENYQESSKYRTLDTDYNVVSVGTYVEKALEEQGIEVIHDTSLHDYPSYNDAYANSRQAVEGYLQEYPTIRLVLDLHRDAMEDQSGNQIASTVQTDRGQSAKIMLVVGTDASGLSHPHWQENMALALKLYVQLERLQPGICRPISFRSQRFNQDLSTGALIVEMGAAGNTRQEALVAAEYLVQSILALARGTSQ